jgi:hypothetical protein
MMPGFQERGIQDQLATRDDTQADQLPDQAYDEEKQG